MTIKLLDIVFSQSDQYPSKYEVPRQQLHILIGLTIALYSLVGVQL